MPLLNPDTSAAEDFSQPIDPGVYPARIVAVEAGKSKAGNDKIVPKLKINAAGKERTRVAHLVVSGAGAWSFDQLLRAVHMESLAEAYRDPEVQPKPPFDTDALIGHELMVIVDTDIYANPATNKEELRDRVTGFLPK